MKPFEPHPLLRNPHAQTLASTFWPRRFPRLPASTPREFEVEPGTRILGECHWQPSPQECPTLVLVHGLEGSSLSGYMLGLAERAFASGWNAVRLNQRNCGGTERLTPTLLRCQAISCTNGISSEDSRTACAGKRTSFRGNSISSRWLACERFANLTTWSRQRTADFAARPIIMSDRARCVQSRKYGFP